MRSALELPVTLTRVAPAARAGLVALSAGLLIASFPPFSVGVVCAWVALVPLLFAVRGTTPVQAAALGAAWALLAHGGIFQWMRLAGGFRWYHFIALDFLYCFPPALWCALISRMRLERFGDLCAAAASWALLEYVRTHAGFLALPLATIAHTQIDAPAIAQVAALLGEPAVSFLVVLGNLILYRALSVGVTRALLIASSAILVSAAAGAAMLSTGHTSEQRVRSFAALDTHYAVRGARKLANDARAQATLTLMAHDSPEESVLLVLPESAFVNPHPQELASLRAIAEAHGVALVFGVSQVAKFEQHRFVPERRVSNAAGVIVPGVEPIQRYEKVIRMPFAEYLPLSSWVAWPRWLVGYPPEVIAGPGPRVFDVGKETHVGVMICWEVLVSAHARALAGSGATALAVIANDGWFGSRGAASLQSLAARMRAVETRRPVVLAVNEGTSMVIDRFGRVAAHGWGDSAQWVRADVAMDTVQTPYTRLGDLFVGICGLMVLLTSFDLLALVDKRSMPRIGGRQAQ
jgi:apolipoprotein N-acyltransferase